MFGVLRSGDWAWIWKQGHLICEIEWCFSTRKLWVYHEASFLDIYQAEINPEAWKTRRKCLDCSASAACRYRLPKYRGDCKQKRKREIQLREIHVNSHKRDGCCGAGCSTEKRKEKGGGDETDKKDLVNEVQSYPQTSGSESNAPNFQALNLFPKPSNCYYKYISKELRDFWLSYKGFICHLSKIHNSWRQ